MNNRFLYITHCSILDVDIESYVRSTFTRAIPFCTLHIHHSQRLYVFTRAPSFHQQDHLLLFLDFWCWSALLSFKSFGDKFDLLARLHRIFLCHDVKLRQNPTCAKYLSLSAAGTTKYLVSRMSAEILVAFPSARRLGSTCLSGPCIVLIASVISYVTCHRSNRNNASERFPSGCGWDCSPLIFAASRVFWLSMVYVSMSSSREFVSLLSFRNLKTVFWLRAVVSSLRLKV